MLCHVRLGLFTKKLLERPDCESLLQSDDFMSMLQRLDTDGQVASVVDVERAHGRMRMKSKFGSSHKSLPAAAGRTFISEWQTLHEDVVARLEAMDGLTGLPRPMSEQARSQPCERLRSVLHHYKKFQGELKKTNQRRLCGGGAKMMFVLFRDALDKTAAASAGGGSRTLAQHRASIRH